ncbi:MAG: ferredoxin [Bacillota bacterium]|nr:ferredoxin [Bacillota bacterium]
MKKRGVIDPAKCDNKPGCAANKICPVNAIEKNDDDRWYIGVDCTGCEKCSKVCQMKAIEFN